MSRGLTPLSIFQISLGSQIDQNEVDWRAFLALAKAFKFDWKEIQQRRAKLWAKDQWDVRRQMEQIKQAAQMRPIKAELKGSGQIFMVLNRFL